MADTVRDVMSGDPVCLDSNATLCEAAEQMAERDIGDVLIVEEGGLRGIATDRDIVVRGLSRHLDPESATLGDILSGDVVTVDAEDSIDRAVQLMRNHAVRRLPVMSGSKPIGIVSIGDLAEERDPTSALAGISSASPNN